ncbi:MAG: iron-sulfur cluster assembly scaffold protein [Candidatus Diapherotrites archaeon]
MYGKKVMDEFKNPKGMGRIEGADGVGTVGNPQCGDVMKVYIKVQKGKIADVKVETYGCVAAIATSSMVAQMVKGKTIAAAGRLTKEEVAKKLGGLPPIKMHCSVLAVDGLRAAIEDYLERDGREEGKVVRGMKCRGGLARGKRAGTKTKLR